MLAARDVLGQEKKKISAVLADCAQSYANEMQSAISASLMFCMFYLLI